MTGDDAAVDDGDEAVSPVIGTILMVAITVIIAGVVTTAFLGFKPIPQTNVNAAVQVQYDPNQDQVWVTYVERQSSDYLNVTFSTGSVGDAKGTLVDVGGKVIVEEGKYYIQHENDNGRIAYNFTSPVPEGATIDVTVTAVKGPTEDGWKRTVIYTDEGQI